MEKTITDKEEKALFSLYAKEVGVFKKRRSHSTMYPIMEAKDFKSLEQINKAYLETNSLLIQMKSLGDLLYPKDFWDREYVLAMIRSILYRRRREFLTGQIFDDE